MRWLVGVALATSIVALAVASPADDARAANVRGMKLYATKDYAAAAKEFRAAIAAQPGFVLAHYNLASMAALLGDKPTVLAELHWLKDSKDPDAQKALAKAPTDPDLHSMIDDPDVRKLLAPDCDATCKRESDACMVKCGDARGCLRLCDQANGDCNAGCAIGMNAEARARMHAWLSGGITGRDNDAARMREASISRPDQAPYGVYIKNQFGFTCVLSWGDDGAPAELAACVAADAKWQAAPGRIPLKCAVSKKQNVDHCEGAFTLSSGDYHDDGRFALERSLK